MLNATPRALRAVLLGFCVFTAAQVNAAAPTIVVARDVSIEDVLKAPAEVREASSVFSVDALPNDPTRLTETESNNTFATANVLTVPPTGGRITGNIIPNTDEDWYAITAQAGDKLYAATMSQASSPGSVDTTMEIIAADGTTVLETDLDDGSFGASASSVAGTLLSAGGTYYIRLRSNTTQTQFIRPYDLYVQLQRGVPHAEVEPNDATAQNIGTLLWVSGEVTATTDLDHFGLQLNAGDTVYVGLDLDPERNGGEGNLRLGMGPLGGFTLLVNDGGAGAAPDSEAFFMTARTAGAYYFRVDGNAAAVGTYQLSIAVYPAPVRTGTCTTYNTGPLALPITDLGTTTVPLNVPDNTFIEDVDVQVNLTHPNMLDLDVTLVSPAGNEVALFTDVGAAAASPIFDITIDDEGAIPIGSFTVNNDVIFRPEIQARLEYFDHTSAQGTWNLVIRDDLTANAGTLNNFGVTICSAPPPPTASTCPVGFVSTVAYSSDFEADDGGFTHTGTLDEWERGLPSLAPITTCNSGTNCWKTDLDGGYDNSATMDLLSPVIDLTGFVGPVFARWAQRYSVENSSFDHFNIEVFDGTTTQRLLDWTGATMQQTMGTGAGVNVPFSAGWATEYASIDAFAGVATTQLRFHLDSDTSVPLSGVAIDDVTVFGCRAISADLGIAIDDGLAAAQAGSMINYAVLVTSPAGATGPVGAAVSTSVDPQLQDCSYTCTASAGSACAGGTGNIADTATLLPGGQANYTLICLLPGGATGTLTSNASVSITGGTDPASANNTDSDVDPITPAADGIFQDGFE